MMKSLIKILALTAVASALLGLSYAHSRAKEVKTETRVFCVTVMAGDTLDGILGEHFNPDTEGKSWNEWNHEQRELNNNLRFHLDGTPRQLQIGDRVHIVAKVKAVR